MFNVLIGTKMYVRKKKRKNEKEKNVWREDPKDTRAVCWFVLIHLNQKFKNVVHIVQ